MLSYALAAAMLSQTAPQLDIVYREVGGRELKLDYYPAVTTGVAPPPLVVVLHGGAWITGKRQDMAAMCMALSRQGMAAATVQYRLAPTSKWPSQIDDAQAAVRHLRKNAAKYRFNADRVGAAGFSAGAHLALLLGSMETRDKTGPDQDQSSRVKAVLNIYGPTDLMADFEPFLAGMIAQQLVGKPIDQAEPEIRSFSPVNVITKDSAPMFTIHGTADRVVPFAQAGRLDGVAKKLGVEHKFRAISNFGHEDPSGNPKALEALMEGIGWLMERLSGVNP
jgi:acetyl esterase/lipase